MDGVEWASGLLRRVVDAVSNVVVGHRGEIEALIAVVAAGGHVLFEGPPGAGKTLVAKALAQAVGGSFSRVQGNPDTLPTDLTGFYIYSLAGERRFVRGPLFSNIVMVDELNRIPPRAQAALLQAMAEYQVSVEGEVYGLERPFRVVATQIPQPLERGVYPLTLTLKDRFWASIPLGYIEGEEEIISRSDSLYSLDVGSVERAASPGDLVAIEEGLRSMVHASERVVNYIAGLLKALRAHPSVALGPSHRAGVHLYRASKARALLEGRDYVIPDDVKAMARYVLPHRLELRPEAGITPRELVEEALATVPVPKE